MLPIADRPVTAPPAAQRWNSVSGKDAARAVVNRPDRGEPWSGTRVSWPGAGSATVDLRDTGTARAVSAGNLPVRVAREQASAPSRMTVSLLDRDRSRRAGVEGLVFRTETETETVAGNADPVRVWVTRTRCRTTPTRSRRSAARRPGVATVDGSG